MKTFKMHRHENNPKEKEFYETFIEEHSKGIDMDLIVFGHPNNSMSPNDHLTDREKQIVLSTIQWLGSPVGQGFLSSCGFSAKQKFYESKNNI